MRFCTFQPHVPSLTYPTKVSKYRMHMINMNMQTKGVLWNSAHYLEVPLNRHEANLQPSCACSQFWSHPNWTPTYMPLEFDWRCQKNTQTSCRSCTTQKMLNLLCISPNEVHHGRSTRTNHLCQNQLVISLQILGWLNADLPWLMVFSVVVIPNFFKPQPLFTTANGWFINVELSLVCSQLV